MIQVERLTKKYGARTAVSGISFAVEKGEIVGFLGPNGAGKSTTLRMLTGFLAPTDGAIKIDGIDALEDPLAARRRLGYMPEGVPLYMEMRVEEYLRYRAALKDVPRRQVAARVEESLKLAHVAEVRSRLIGQLSKGYRQRVGLADALVGDPPLLVLDEPTAGLDPNQIREVRDLVKSFAGKKTVLLSTHILPEVEATCSRVLIIHEGKLVGSGAPDTLRTAEKGARSVVHLVAKGEQAKLETELGTIAGAKIAITQSDDGFRLRIEAEARGDLVEDVFKAVVAAGCVLRELRQEALTLEDVFAHLTTAEAAAPGPALATDADTAVETAPAEEEPETEEPSKEEPSKKEEPR